MTDTHDNHAGQDDDAEVVIEAAAPTSGGLAARLLEPGTVRGNLMVVAAFLCACNVVFALVQAGSHPSAADVSAISLLVRAAVDAAVFLVLRSRPQLGRWGLLAAEAALFGIEMLVLLDSQYFTLVALIDRGDLIDAVAFQKNGILRVVVLILCNAIFVPHRPLITGRIAATMAAALIVCHGLVLDHAIAVDGTLDDVATYRTVMINALFLMLTVVLAILTAWVLRRGRDVVAAGGRIGGYKLLRQLDAGGMGEVYLAEHETLGRPCVVKVLPADRRHDPVDRELFSREIRAAARLRHPNAVQVFDAGQAADGTLFCAMEHLPGLDVAELVRRSGPLPPGRVIHLGRQICGALADTHRQGLVHRDLSPGNVFVSVLAGTGDVVKVLDLGVASDRSTDDPAGGRGVAGTPAFVAPEQARAGGVVDGRSDVYGLGSLLYAMLGGRPPFEGTPEEVLRAKLAGAAVPLRERRPDVPADLEAVVMRCLARDPADRYPDVDAVAAALAACRSASAWNDDAAAAWWHHHVAGGPRRPAAS